MKWRFSLTVNPAMKDLREWRRIISDADESDGGGSCGCKDGSFGGSDQCHHSRNMKSGRERSVFLPDLGKSIFYGSIRQRKRNPEC